MIYADIYNQRLKLISVPVAADTIDYLEMKFCFRTDDWNGLEKWAHFAQDGTVYDIRLTDDCIRKEDHLNLTAGTWKVYLHGNEYRDGEVVQRITTGEEVFEVQPTGTLDGEPFPEMPASVTEQILARLENVEQNGVGGGTPGTVSIVPHIGENGNWYIGRIDTGVKAQGEPGQPGADGSPGADGQPGQDGTSVTVSSVAESDADGGSNVVTFSDGKTLTVKNGKTGTPGAPGESGADGKSAYQIWLEAGNTGTEADFLEAIKGADGSPGQPGADGSPGQDGQPGSDGADGITPHIGENGNWWIGDTDTGKPAQGEPGENGITPTVWLLSVRVTTPENGAVVAELYKDGVLCTDRMYLKVYVSSGGGDWRAHGTGTGYFTETKTWSYGGSADGVAWKCVVYADDTMSDALAAGTAATGTDGHTPVKGTDYYTEADKTEMVNAVLAALPAWEGGSY